jgi:hypothetical protein
MRVSVVKKVREGEMRLSLERGKGNEGKWKFRLSKYPGFYNL